MQQTRVDGIPENKRCREGLHMLLLYMLHGIVPCFAACADCQGQTMTLKNGNAYPPTDKRSMNKSMKKH